MPNTLSPHDLGERGESTAARYLVGKGYKVLDTNWRWRRGEIDLVAEDSREVVFVEVKSRRSQQFGAPEEAITQKKREKLIQTALAYLSSVGRQGSAWRIDMIAIDFTPDGALERLDHYESAVEGN